MRYAFSQKDERKTKNKRSFIAFFTPDAGFKAPRVFEPRSAHQAIFLCFGWRKKVAIDAASGSTDPSGYGLDPTLTCLSFTLLSLLLRQHHYLCEGRLSTSLETGIDDCNLRVTAVAPLPPHDIWESVALDVGYRQVSHVGSL